MNFLNKLFGKKEPSSLLPVIKSHSIAVNNSLNIHPEFVSLIWIGDGPNKNYYPKRQGCGVYIKGLDANMTFHFSNNEEPSLILLSLPIKFAENKYIVDNPSYFPTYVTLTPEQRGVYWKFLENPYSSDINIGYVFVLYYGLERHLLEGDYERAFYSILRLRDTYNNKSFQSYSGCALVLTAMIHQRPDLVQVFCSSLDKEYENNFSDDLFLLCKSSLNIPLNAKDIMRMSKSFGFDNLNYIKKYPEIFEQCLSDVITKKYNTNFVEINSLILKTEWKKMKIEKITAYANMSLIDTKLSIPLISESFLFKKTMYDLIEVAHDMVKQTLSENRKNGVTIAPIKANKAAKVISFDQEMELSLLTKYNKFRNNAMEKHFCLIELQNFYYKHREISQDYLQKCIQFCLEDIYSLNLVQEQHKNEEGGWIKQNAFMYTQSEIQKKLSEIECFKGTIPAFKRLSIIYEKSKNYNEAIKICDQAIQYYLQTNNILEKDEFLERRNKIYDKLNKSSNP